MNLKEIEKRYTDGQVVDAASLFQRGLIKEKGDAVKILGSGDLARKLAFRGVFMSASAKEKIEKAGGSVKLPKGSGLLKESAPAKEGAVLSGEGEPAANSAPEGAETAEQ